jgi:hypothetical protein
MPFTGAVLCIKKEIMLVREQVVTCFLGWFHAYKRKEWGKKTVMTCSGVVTMHKEEKNDGKRTGFDLLFGVVSYIQKETMKAR